MQIIILVQNVTFICRRCVFMCTENCETVSEIRLASLSAAARLTWFPLWRGQWGKPKKEEFYLFKRAGADNVRPRWLGS